MTINYDDIKPFEYQQAAFLIGLKLEIIKDVQIKGVIYSRGSHAYVDRLTDFGQGCVLDVRFIPLDLSKHKRLGLFDTKSFFDIFRPAHFYP